MSTELKPEWFVLVVMPGHEIKVRDKILALAKNQRFKDIIFDARVSAKTSETATGAQKEKVEDYTQYVFVNMIYDPDNDTGYHGVKVEGVRHILGAPSPLEKHEVERLIGELL